MPALDVFRDPDIVGTITFHGQLMIWEDLDGHLHWGADDELREARVGIIRIWALREFNGHYSIRFVLPAWALTIDGVACEHKLYEDLDLSGRRIELEFAGYRFVFH